MSVTEERMTVIGQQFSREGNRLERTLTLPDGEHRSSVTINCPTEDPLGDWWKAYLAGERPAVAGEPGLRLRTVDLFCGPGGLAQGFSQGCAELGYRVVSQAAADQDLGALEVYGRNHRARLLTHESVDMLVDYRLIGARANARLRYEPSMVQPQWAELTGSVDVVLAGPPCQGHSNLNNKTRRDDGRNELYLAVPAIAIALQAPIVIIENVPAVVHDRLGVVESTRRILEDAGYTVATGTIRAARLGWAQNRDRFFLIARRGREPLALSAVNNAMASEARSVWWAIGELEHSPSDDHMNVTTETSEENRKRIDWLFDNDAYDLALHQRPDCHKDGTTYGSVYGRLHRDRPAPTITTGFMTPGRGRYIHPTQRRVLRPREAARLQGFPDTYRFDVGDRRAAFKSQLSKWIGDAVPMPLGHAAAISALGAGW